MVPHLQKKGVTADGVLPVHSEKNRTDDPTTAPLAANQSKSSTNVMIGALCFCMLTHSYLLISVFPYSGFLAMHLVHVDEDHAGQYAGIIASSFMVGRAITSFAWGKVADLYGRRTVLYVSLALSCVWSILFGLTSHSLTFAILFRFLMGCSNGIMSAIKTLVSEISCETTEAKTMSLVMGMWGWGFLMSPALSGALAEPVRQYPGWLYLAEGTVAGEFLREFPFFLPNLLGALLCVLAILFIKLSIYETLPLKQQHDPVVDMHQLIGRFRRSLPGYRYDAVSVLRDVELPCHANQDKTDFPLHSSDTNTMPSATIASLLSNDNTRKTLFIYWGYSFVGLVVDEAFPLFCLSHTAGFGIPEKDIGQVLSFCGFIFAICQYCVTTTVYNKFGLIRSVKVGTLLSAPMMFLVPLSLLFQRGSNSSQLRWSTFLFLASLLAVHRCFALVFFANISVVVNRTVPSYQRATVNGLSVFGGSVAKAIGPTFAGVLTTVSVSWLGQSASLLVFGTIGCLGLLVTGFAFSFMDDGIAAERKGLQYTSDDNIELNHTAKTTS